MGERDLSIELARFQIKQRSAGIYSEGAGWRVSRWAITERKAPGTEGDSGQKDLTGRLLKADGVIRHPLRRGGG